MPDYANILEDILCEIYSVGNWTVKLNDTEVISIQQSLKDIYFTYREKDTNAKEALDKVLKKISEIAMNPNPCPLGLQAQLTKIWDKYTRKIMEEER